MTKLHSLKKTVNDCQLFLDETIVKFLFTGSDIHFILVLEGVCEETFQVLYQRATEADEVSVRVAKTYLTPNSSFNMVKKP